MARGTHWYSDEHEDWNTTQKRQAAQLPEFLERLQATSGLYSDQLASVQATKVTSIAALGELPFTSKEDLRRGQAEPVEGTILGLQQYAKTDEIQQVISSSGTTGAPVFFGQTRRDRQEWADAIGAMYFTAGLQAGSIAALTTGMPMVAGGLPYADGIRETGAALVWVGGQTTSRLLTTLQRARVNTLVATASHSAFLSKQTEEYLGIPAKDLEVQTIVAGGEPGMGQPEIRQSVLEGWGATRVSEVMGLGDVLAGLWGECEAGQGMHFTAYRYVLPELIDPDTQIQIPWTEGAEGEVVYTTFTREATPVIRFRSRDHVVVTGMDCACGRKTPRIRCIGRTDDMLIYKAMNVFPSAIRDIALEQAGSVIDDVMRLRKETPDQVRFDQPIPLEVQMRQPLSEQAKQDVADQIEAEVNRRLRVRVSVEFLPAGSINVGTYKNALTYAADSSK